MRANGAAVLAAAVLGAALGLGSTAPGAQTVDGGIASPVVTLDQERLFGETLWGKRVSRQIEEASAALAAENRRIEAELTAEERALTESRPRMPADQFQAAAEAFDDKVTTIRRDQDAKAREIGRMQDAERQRFLTAILPVLSEVLRARGAVAVLDSRAIFLAAESIDITDAAIARIDAELGDGAPAPQDGAGQGGQGGGD